MPGLNYSLTVPPTIEPVSLSLAKKQVRVDIADDNALIETYIGVAREWCEKYTNRAFYPQEWTLYLDNFPYGDWRDTIPMDQHSPWNYSAYWADFAIRLPKPMCQGVQAINYLDASLNPQTLDPSMYKVDLNSRPARIVPVAGSIWPLTQFYQPGSINVVYQAASYVMTLTETVAVTGTGAPYTGVLSQQVISITSVKDINGNVLAPTASLVNDANSDPTSQTQLSFTAAPPSNQAVVVYQAGMLPKPIVMAMLLIIGHLYEHREENSEVSLKAVPMGVKSFLNRYVYSIFGNYQGGY